RGEPVVYRAGAVSIPSVRQRACNSSQQPIARRSRSTLSMDAHLARTAHAVLRMAGGALFLQHGLQKLYGALGGINGLGATVPVASLLGAAGMLELIGGAL